MCNNYEMLLAWDAYCAMMALIELGIPTQQSELDLPQAANIRIRDLAPVMRVAGNAVELVPMRFGFPPARAGASPVFNFKSEGRQFRDSHRCLVPASAFFEFTGAASPKTRHRFTLRGFKGLAIAGLWREGAQGEPPSFTLLTTEPGPDVKPFHDRQIVVLRPQQWAAWLDLSQSEETLLRPLEAGALAVETMPPGRPAAPTLFD